MVLPHFAQSQFAQSHFLPLTLFLTLSLTLDWANWDWAKLGGHQNYMHLIDDRQRYGDSERVTLKHSVVDTFHKCQAVVSPWNVSCIL